LHNKEGIRPHSVGGGRQERETGKLPSITGAEGELQRIWEAKHGSYRDVIEEQTGWKKQSEPGHLLVARYADYQTDIAIQPRARLAGVARTNCRERVEKKRFNVRREVQPA